MLLPIVQPRSGALIRERHYLAGLSDYEPYVGNLGVATSLVGLFYSAIIVAVLILVGWLSSMLRPG